MEIIILAAIIVGVAIGLIYYYNRDKKNLDIDQNGKVDARDAKKAVKNAAAGLVKDARDARDLALSLTSESAAKAINAVERSTKRTTNRKPATKSTAKPAAKPAAKPRARKSSK